MTACEGQKHTLKYHVKLHRNHIQMEILPSEAALVKMYAATAENIGYGIEEGPMGFPEHQSCITLDGGKKM